MYVSINKQLIPF